MLNTVIDFEVFVKFCCSRPKQVPEGTHEENEIWISFWRFLKSDSNVVITNYNETDLNNPQNLFLNNLTQRSNISTCHFGKLNHHNFYLPKYQNIHTVYFINESDVKNQTKFRKNNGFFFSFNDEYIDKWKELSFSENSVLHDRKSAEVKNRFSWERFSDYLLPFTDVIVRDNFIFKDINHIQDKFGKLIECFNKATKVKYNLLIIFNKSNLDIAFGNNIADVYKYLEHNKIFDPNRLNLGLVHTSKEHDRFMFFNYVEVDIGKFPDDSHRPTKLTFFPFSDQNNFSNAEPILSDFSDIVEEGEKNKETYGYIRNRLLSVTNEKVVK